LKFIHNEKLSLIWAIVVEVTVHALFAFQAFLMGGFLGEVALAAIFGSYLGTRIGAYALGIFVFGAAFQAFVLGEYMREHVESFETTEKGDGSYLKAWKQLRYAVGGIEIASLLFRCVTIAQTGNWVSISAWSQAVIVALMGGILLWYAYAQAKVIHASVNRPAAYDMMQAQQTVGKSLSTDSLKYIDDMTPEQKARFYAGDISALQETAEEKLTAQQIKEQNKELANGRKQAERIRKEQEAAEKAERKQANAKRGSDAATRLLDPSTWKVGKSRPKDEQDFLEAQMNDQASRLSRNGKQN
jgi:hypothetical protein